MTARQEARRSIASIACFALALVAAGCSGSDDSGEAGDTTSSSAAPSKPAIICNGVDEVNEDDDGAVPALLNGGQLPPGQWTTAKTPPCPWALSADELLAVPECRATATAAGAAPNEESRNGNARVTFSQGDMQLDDRIEIYTSRQNVDSIRAILAGPALPDCYTAALEQRATEEESDTKVSNVSVSRFTVQPDAAALGLSFPAVAGYAADPGFVEGVNVTFTRTTKGESIPVAMRVISFGGGGLMSTITVTGSTEEVDGIDLTPTLRAAAASYLTMVSPDR